MVVMPTHEEKWLESVLFSKYDGKSTVKFHSDGNTAMEASLLNSVIRWDPTAGRSEVGGISSCNSCGQASEVARTSTGGKRVTSERRGYYVVQVSHDAPEQFVSGPPSFVISYRPFGTRDEDSHHQGP